MIETTKQKQGGGDNSTNLQGQSIVINQGISYSDAKEIALDVFNSNILQYREEAKEVAQERAEKVTDCFLSELMTRNPSAISQFKTPAMQDALFTVQKQFAKSGDDDLGDILVDILVDRAGEEHRNMLQIVLDESLSIAPKLTIEQLDTLTINFLLAQTRRSDLRDTSDLKKYLNNNIGPFIQNLTVERTYYNHIEFLGCGHVRAGNYGELEVNLRRTYKGFFSKGFSREEFEESVGDMNEFRPYIIQCLRDKSKFQISAFDDQALEKISKDNSTAPESFKKIKSFYETTTLPHPEVKRLIIEDAPEMEKVFKAWKESPINQLELTGVGIAIAHANYRRKTGEAMDLTIWIK